MNPEEPSADESSRWRHHPEAPVPDPFAHVVAPPDQGRLARQAVVRLRELLLQTRPDQAELLVPFLDGISALVEQAWPIAPPSHQTALGDDRSETAPSEEEGEMRETAEPDFDEDDEQCSPTEAAATLVAEVEQLEDLLEALRAVRRD